MTNGSKKKSAHILAHLVSSLSKDNGLENKLRHDLGLNGDVESERGLDKSKQIKNNEDIGIWKRQTISGESWFVKNFELMPEFDLWADTQKFRAKKQKKRIILLGESVARGCLLVQSTHQRLYWRK